MAVWCVWARWPVGNLNAEALTTTAAIPLIRIVELKALIQSFAHKVQLRAVDISQALGIDHHLDAIALKHDVVRILLVHIFQLVGQTGAASGFHPQAYPDPFAALCQVAIDVARSCIRERDCHFYSAA